MMKAISFLFVLAFTPTLGFSESIPLMPKNMLQKSIEDVESLSSPPCEACCDKNFSLFKADQDSFDASISCQFQCADKEIIKKSVRASFNTTALNMWRGNGNLWGLLTLNLTYWSEETCLVEALKDCKSLENIQDLSVAGIQSGDWSINGKITCVTPQAITSPLDSRYKNTLLKSSAIKRGPLPKNIRFDWDAKKASTENDALAPACQRKIKVKRCFGDCISLDNEVMTEQLSSPSPLGVDEIELCADSYDQKLKGKNLSPAVKQHLCETFTMAEIKKTGGMELSCASYRYQVSCN